MLAKRIIPCLDVHNGRVTRGEQFGRAELGQLQDMGDPVSLALEYDRQGADELVFYDITATSEGRAAMVDVILRVSEVCFMPLTVGGGVRTLEDFRRLFLAGADKVSLNSGALADPSLIDAASEHYGAQAVVLSIDCLKADGGWRVMRSGGREGADRDPVGWAIEGVARGAGEIVVNSIDADGMKQGYDIPLMQAVAEAVDVPVVASGGAGSAAHMLEVLQKADVDAALAAGIFHRGEATVADVKRLLAREGIEVREP